MAVVPATADVLSLRVHGNDDTALDNTSSVFSSLFPNAAPSDRASGGHAAKRRKISSGESVPADNPAVFDESKSVVLGRVALDLRLPLGIFALPLQGYTEEKPLQVSIESFSRDSTESFTISLLNPKCSASSIDLRAVASADVLDATTPHLEFIAALRNTVLGRKRSATNSSGASFCRCLLFPSSTSLECLTLFAEIRWLVGLPVVETLSPRSQKYALDLDILSNYFPGGSYQEQVPWRLNDFYDAVHMPSKDTPVSPRLEANVLETKLYPFQIRAVDWLLRREGVTYPLSGGPLSPIDESSATLPVSFQPEKDATGNDIYVSHLRGSVLSELNKMNVPPLRGGILAEEMGLGKTVELLALMRHHRRRLPDGDVFDAYTGAMVKPSGATLIITPPSILEQWINEIGTHAPDLKVKHYKGIPAASAPQREHDEATWEHLMQFDVVLTTYAVLAREIHFATPPPNRSLRFEKQHEARKSPLVQISWWRVCLDEAQMVESGVSNAATVARLIPRCNAWAISGTPLRKDVSDLRGLLVFLRYEPFSTSKIAWGRLDKSTFRTLFHQITLRHTKDKIRDELRLPPQKRVVITVPFTAIEEQNYSDLIRQMCEACGLSPEGRPLSGDRDLTDWEVLDRMREWLIRLRQTCLHAHVGRKNRAALGAKNGPIRTVHEVLEVMIDQNDTAKKTEAREYILTFLRSGHIKGNAGDDEKRSESALPYYKEALEEAQKWVRLCRDELAEEQKKVGKPVLDNLEADEESKEGENLGRIPIIRNSLRSFAELEHACKFFIGTVYFQIKSNEKLTAPDSEEFHSLEKLEVQWYDEAKVIRKELLQETQRKAQHQMKRISSSQPFHQLRKISDLPDLGGIEGRKILTMMDDICDLLNAQADQLVIWRQKIVDILLLPLVDEEEKETTGDEYEDSTKVQDELYVYTLALRSLVANRNEAVNGEADLLANYELKAAEDLAKGKRVFNEWRGHAPELVLEVAHICHKLKRTTESGSLKAVVAATRSLITTLQWKLDGGDHRASAELSILENQLLKIQKIANEEAKALLELEKEQELFRAAMNQRLEFYRQLQHISDTVAPWREELDAELDKKAFEDNARKQALVKKRLSTCISQQAYLHNLRAENQKADEVRECIICKCDFEAGILTSCGHAFCKECIMEWWGSHRTCPVCKEKLRLKDLKEISFKPVQIKAKEETHDQGASSAASTPSSHSSIYSDISDSVMKEIKMIDLDGSYGSKIDMIARHLLWIRANDPGAKSIIFSQFSDFLEVLRQALKRWKIGSSSIRDKDGISKFRSDPAVDCFLLDAKSDSSGLNLVNATYVFLCEPLINPAIELQAIARVHRIGQQRPTTVYMYLVSDTVEEAIYDISVSRRLEHMGRASESPSQQGTPPPTLREKALDAANSMELEAAPLKQLLRKKGDGEIVQAADLWNCLFGKPRKQRGGEVLDQVVSRHLRAEAAEDRIREGEA